MAEPTSTVLDAGYSDPAATATSWATTRAALESAELSWVSTVRPDGRPHVTPVVGVWAEDAFWFSTGEGERKFANLQTDPHVVVTTGAATWDHGLDVVLEGVAVQVSDDEVLARIAPVFAARWDGRWQWTVRDGAFRGAGGEGGAMVFRVAPVKVWAHAKGDPFGATRHTFAPTS